jgi:hypothetical protein
MNTIDTILKIAKVKDMDSFYKKFPSEKAFMAKYGKEFKKAMKGATIKKAQDGFNMSNKFNTNMNDWFNTQHAGLSQEDQLKLNPLQTWNFSKQPFMGNNNTPSPESKGSVLGGALPIVGDVVKGFQMLKDEKNRMNEAEQWRDVSNVQLQASNLQPERVNNRYVRPEDNVITGEEYFPIYGTGSNPLAKKGAKIKAQSGAGVPWDMVGNKTSNILEGIMGEDGGGTIGGAIGKGVGSIFGPVGGAVGQVGGQLIGSILDTRPERTQGYLKQAERNASAIMANAGAKGIHNIYSGYMEDGGEIPENYNNAWSKFYELQPEYTKALSKKYPDIPIKDILSESVKDTSFRNTKVGDYAQNLIGTYGDFHLNDAEMDSIANANGADIRDMERVLSKYDYKDNDRYVRTKGTKEATQTDYKFGPRMMLHRRYDQGKSPYKYLDEPTESMAEYKDGGKITGMELDGELQMLENRADVKPISYNPFLPDGGETVQFQGPSHAKGGMDISFGNTPVEVEGGEPATKIDEDGLVVYGDLVAPGYKGKKFKNVVKDISKKEKKQSNLIERAITDFESTDIQTPLDKLKVKTLETNIKGATMKQKELAQEKSHLASLQEAINQAADEQNLDASSLAKGKIKKAKKSDRNKAQDGKNVPDSLYKSYGYQPVLNPTTQQIAEAIMQMQDKRHNTVNSVGEVDVYGEKPPTYVNYPSAKMPNFNQIYDFYPQYQNREGQDVPIRDRAIEDVAPIGKTSVTNKATGTGTGKASGKTTTKESVEATNEFDPVGRIEPLSGTPQVGSTMSSDSGIAKKEMDKLAKKVNKGKPKGERVNGEELWNTLSSLIPYFKPSDVEGLDPSQIAGELAALSDKEEPVWAQTLQPDLSTPYELSLQDQKNEIIAGSRAAQRMTGNNPAAQAMIAAQTSEAMNKIQGEEFRINQAMKDKVYTENRNMMNQTRFQNLAILDKLYERQSMAKSKTKDTLRNALNSISDKYLKNRFENRTLATYENPHDYRFDDRGRAWHMGRPASFNTEGSDMEQSRIPYDEDYVPRYERDPQTGRERVVGTRRRTKGEKISRNGSIVRSLKRI